MKRKKYINIDFNTRYPQTHAIVNPLRYIVMADVGVQPAPSPSAANSGVAGTDLPDGGSDSEVGVRGGVALVSARRRRTRK